MVAGQGRAEVPESLAASTVKMAVLVAKGSAVAGLGSAATVSLTRAALKAMFVSRVRIAAVVGLLLGGGCDDDRFRNPVGRTSARSAGGKHACAQR